jgi:REP element-mobilizing transposase RayT
VPRTTFPLAYHITWGTYGTRLHGDERGTVDRGMNNYGDPIIGQDGDWQRIESSLLRFPPRILNPEQRVYAEQVLPAICVRGKWNLITAAAAPDHVHILLSAAVEGKDIRKWLKRWLSDAMSGYWPLEPQQVWWAECGSVKWVWNQDYYQQVAGYVQRQRATR